MKYWKIIKKVIEQRSQEADTAGIQPERSIQVTTLFAERLIADYNTAKGKEVAKFDPIQGDIYIPYNEANWRVHYNSFREDSYDADVEKTLLDSL